MSLKEHKLQKDNSETDFLLESQLFFSYEKKRPSASVVRWGFMWLFSVIIIFQTCSLCSQPYQKSRVALHNESGPSFLAWSFTRC